MSHGWIEFANQNLFQIKVFYFTILLSWSIFEKDTDLANQSCGWCSFNFEVRIHTGSGDRFANGPLAWLPIENRTAFPWSTSLLWHFRCWFQNHNYSKKSDLYVFYWFCSYEAVSKTWYMLTLSYFEISCEVFNSPSLCLPCRFMLKLERVAETHLHDMEAHRLA